MKLVNFLIDPEQYQLAKLLAAAEHIGIGEMIRKSLYKEVSNKLEELSEMPEVPEEYCEFVDQALRSPDEPLPVGRHS